MNKKLYFLYYFFMLFPSLISLIEFWKYINQLSNSGFSLSGVFPMLFVAFISLCVFLGYKSRVSNIMRKETVESIRKRMWNEKKYMIFTNITIFVLIFHPPKTSSIIYVWEILLILSMLLLQINYYFGKKKRDKKLEK